MRIKARCLMLAKWGSMRGNTRVMTNFLARETPPTLGDFLKGILVTRGLEASNKAAFAWIASSLEYY